MPLPAAPGRRCSPFRTRQATRRMAARPCQVPPSNSQAMKCHRHQSTENWTRRHGSNSPITVHMTPTPDRHLFGSFESKAEDEINTGTAAMLYRGRGVVAQAMAAAQGRITLRVSPLPAPNTRVVDLCRPFDQPQISFGESPARSPGAGRGQGCPLMPASPCYTPVASYPGVSPAPTLA